MARLIDHWLDGTRRIKADRLAVNFVDLAHLGCVLVKQHGCAGMYRQKRLWTLICRSSRQSGSQEGAGAGTVDRAGLSGAARLF
jgi:hypothetical protein